MPGGEAGEVQDLSRVDDGCAEVACLPGERRGPARGLGIDTGHPREIAERGALDLLERAEMAQQRALARRADAGDFLQAGLAVSALCVLLAGSPRKTSGLQKSFWKSIMTTATCRGDSAKKPATESSTTTREV